MHVHTVSLKPIVLAVSILFSLVNSPYAAAQAVPGPIVTFKDRPTGFSCVITTRRACTTRNVPPRGPVESCVTEAVTAHFVWDRAPRDKDGKPYYIFEIGSAGSLMPALKIDGSSYDFTFGKALRNRSASFWLRKVDGTTGNGYTARVEFTVKDDLQGDIPCFQR